METYFAYGSNLDVVQMRSRCPSAKILGKAVLKGYRLSFTIFSNTRRCGCADIVPCPQAEVWGVLYEITAEDLKKLDKFEGHPKQYRRMKVTVTDDSGTTVYASSYEVVHKSAVSLKPSTDYLGKLISAAHKYNFPPEYRSFLDKVELL